jgi:hypothetical protein
MQLNPVAVYSKEEMIDKQYYEAHNVQSKPIIITSLNISHDAAFPCLCNQQVIWGRDQ